MTAVFNAQQECAFLRSRIAELQNEINKLKESRDGSEQTHYSISQPPGAPGWRPLRAGLAEARGPDTERGNAGADHGGGGTQARAQGGEVAAGYIGLSREPIPGSQRAPQVRLSPDVTRRGFTRAIEWASERVGRVIRLRSATPGIVLTLVDEDGASYNHTFSYDALSITNFDLVDAVVRTMIAKLEGTRP